MLDGSVGFHDRQSRSDTSGVLYRSGDDYEADLGLRVGTRRYHTLGDRTGFFVTMGGTVGLTAFGYRQSPGGDYRTSTWSLGPFAEVGALTMLHRHLSVGALCRFVATYSHTHTTSPNETRVEGSEAASVQLVSLVGTVYF